ncbi:putative macrophage mannose receptor 1-like [Triplophysa rosa]|uniref:Macrophage mannose receptor 1-like n=1 Tax=Triplophysa rosa TaxID=992332 RepID=A0A9W7WW78_TRIRA|nr:putative macrophage mannose receptor 1-like [Triplophysa rosa]
MQLLGTGHGSGSVCSGALGCGLTNGASSSQHSCEQNNRFICSEVYKKQIIRLNLSCDGNCNLNDPSLKTDILNQVREKLQSVGLGDYIVLNWGEK